MSERKRGSRDGWTRVRFGDVVRLSKERCTAPEAAGIDRYVGLEHLEPGDLRIRSWGDVADGVTFTNRFRPGQVLFGKRRAYQRKVAVAEFDGICSSDIYIFEPADDRLLPGLLPFICQTDGFFTHALKTSAGSLSPRTNWKSLADYEFDLPSIREQRRITKSLRCAAQAEESHRNCCEHSHRLEESLFSYLMRNSAPQEHSAPNDDLSRLLGGWERASICDVADVAYGICAAVADNTDPAIGWPILTGANITLDGRLDLQKLVYHAPPKKESFTLRKGDVLLNWRSGSQEHVGKAAIFDQSGEWTFASFILRIRVGEACNNVFLWRLLNFMRKHRLFGSATSQQVNFKMNAAYFREVRVPCPPLDQQVRIVSQLRRLWNTRDLLNARRQGMGSLATKFLQETA